MRCAAEVMLVESEQIIGVIGGIANVSRINKAAQFGKDNTVSFFI